jgi:S-DNA-T family DNA segregation ATPase FtsK/SpoIIIE
MKKIKDAGSAPVATLIAPATSPAKSAATAAKPRSRSRASAGAAGGSRGGAARKKTAKKNEPGWKQRRPPKPLHPPTPLDEMAGILIVAIGVILGIVVWQPGWMGGLAPVGQWLDATLGIAAYALVAFVILLGAEAFIPHQALGMASLGLSLAVLFVNLDVFADLAGAQGGTVGAGLGDFLRQACGRPGAWTLVVALTLVDLQWITRVSLRGPARLLALPVKLLTWLGERVLDSMQARMSSWPQTWAELMERRRLQREAREAEKIRVEAEGFVPPVTAKPVEGGARVVTVSADPAVVAKSADAVPAPLDEASRFPELRINPAVKPEPTPEPKAAGKSRTDQPAPAPEFDDIEIAGYEEKDDEPPFDVDEAVFDELEDESANDKGSEDPHPWDVEEEVSNKPVLPTPPRLVNYQLPSLELLEAPGFAAMVDTSNDFSRIIVETLNSFGVATRIVNVERGPTVTRYELQPARGVKVSKITSLNNDIALALAAQAIRIEAPIPGKSALGIEVPNSRVDAVRMREIVESSQFVNGTGLNLALGKDISGRPVVADLLRMPHLLIAGATGSGKSVCLNTVIVSILYRATPQEVQMVMVDPKRVELSIFAGIPHLANTHSDPAQRIIKDAKTGTLVLKQATEIMNQRFELLSQNRVRNIAEYNAKAKVPMPYLVIIVDELAQLMQISARSVEGYLQELAQMGRAAGIHLILATQRPSVDVLTGTIKSNFPARIAFAVSAQVDSRTILDRGGAEKLLGRGDMLFSPTDSELRRVQGALITLEETERVVDFWRQQEPPDNLTPLSLEAKNPEDMLGNNGDGGEDADLLREAVRVIKETKLASASNLQRKLMIGYPRAARLVDELEERGFLGPANGSKPRKILFLEGAE